MSMIAERRAPGQTLARVLARHRSLTTSATGQADPPRVARIPGRNKGASGSVNRWLRPDSVRHMSVTTAMQGLTATHHETQRDKSEEGPRARLCPGHGPFSQVMAGVGFEPT